MQSSRLLCPSVVCASLEVLSEPTRSLGAALRGQSRQPLPKLDTEDKPGSQVLGAQEAQVNSRSASSYLVTRPRQRRVAEQFARRLLRDAFGSPSERTVALAPPLTLALMVAWILGRSSRAPNGVRSGSSYAEHLHLEPLMPENGDASRQVSEESQVRSRSARLRKLLRRVRCRRCRPGVWLHCAGLAMILTVVLSLDQEQQRRARIVEQGLGVYSAVSDEEESIHWLNMVVGAVWTPVKQAVSGLGAELAAMFTFQMTPGEGDALSIAFENVTFGLNPPVLDAVRTPRESAVQALGKAMTAARDGRPKGSLRPQVVMMEADLLWVADQEFEVLVKASARSGVGSLPLFPQLRVRLGDFVFGPVPIAVAMEAAPQGYPYVGLVALTFVSEPTVAFSITPENILGGAVSALPLLREALTAGLISSLPLLTDDQVLVYDLGEYLAPGLFPRPELAEHTDVEKPGNQHTRSGLFQWLFKPRLRSWRQRDAQENVVEEPLEPARPLREKRPKEKGRRRRRKHNHADADAGQAEENGISKEARSDVLPTNGDEGPGPGHSRRRRRRRESDAPSPGPGDYAPVHEELDARADHGGRRRPARLPEPTQPEQGTDETRPRPDQWPKPELQRDRGARRRIPPGATAKALPARPRDVRDHDRGERNRADGGHREELLGACDLLGAAQDAMETVEWQRLVMEQEEAMAQQQDSEQPPRPRRRSLTPLARRRAPRDGRELGREGRPWSPRSERDRSAGQGRDLRLKSRSRSRRRNRQPAGRRT
eukprot:s2822_g15.t2